MVGLNYSISYYAMNLDKIKIEIKDLVAKGDTEAAMARLLKHSCKFDDRTQRDITLNSGRLNRALSSIVMGTDDEQTALDIRKVSSSILSIVDNSELRRETEKTSLKRTIALIVILLGLLMVSTVWWVSKVEASGHKKEAKEIVIDSLEQNQSAVEEPSIPVDLNNTQTVAPKTRLRQRRQVEIYYSLVGQDLLKRKRLEVLEECLAASPVMLGNKSITVQVNPSPIPRGENRFSFSGGRGLVKVAGVTCDLIEVKIGHCPISNEGAVIDCITRHIDSSLLNDSKGFCDQVINCIK